LWSSVELPVLTIVARGSAVAVGLTVLLMAVGCVMPDQMSQLEQDMSDVKRDQQALQREQEKTRTELDRLERTPAPVVTNDEGITREEFAELRLRMDQLLRQTQVTDERLNDVNRRLDAYSQELERTRSLMRAGAGPMFGPELPPDEFPGEEAVDDSGAHLETAGAPDYALPDPEALYNTAYTDFSKGNYSLAIAGFEEYQKLFPESALADNALYWIGECHFSQAGYDAAVGAFDDLLQRYPKSDKAAAGNLKKALAFLEQNQVGTGIVQLRYVIKNYPGSDEARIAEDKLAGLGAPEA
jgi:tol-pal system protein YbgF